MHSLLSSNNFKILSFVIILVITQAFAEPLDSFRKAKELAAQVFNSHPVTIYCGCTYSNNDINLHACGLEKVAASKRAHKLEWEHLLRHFSNML